METIKRILQDKISDRITPGKAVLIFGARRVGKTVMMRKIVDAYPGRTMMLNGEDYDTLALLENRTADNYRHLLEGIDLLAIDEAQNIPQVGSILKLIVDEIPGISVLASGSSSFDLLNKTGEPLVGRSTQFLLTPFSQREIAQTETALETRQNLESRLIYGSGGGDDGQLRAQDRLSARYCRSIFAERYFGDRRVEKFEQNARSVAAYRLSVR